MTPATEFLVPSSWFGPSRTPATGDVSGANRIEACLCLSAAATSGLCPFSFPRSNSPARRLMTKPSLQTTTVSTATGLTQRAHSGLGFQAMPSMTNHQLDNVCVQESAGAREALTQHSDHHCLSITSLSQCCKDSRQQAGSQSILCADPECFGEKECKSRLE